MSHASTKVFVHFVWTTKNRERLLLGDTRHVVKSHLEQYTKGNGINAVALAVQPEHVHLLSELGRSQRVEDVSKLVKGESSHWINQSNILKGKFSWQTGYWAGSVCYQHIDVARSYIEGQDEHHRVKGFVEEFEALLREHGYSEAEIAELLRLESR
jgi:REP element-mobilizing transposase RayT